MDGLKQEIDKDLARKINKANPSNKDLADILKHVVENMWSEERLADYIHRVHHSLCAKCSRVDLKDGDDSKGDRADSLEKKMSLKMIALIGSLVTAVVALAGTVAKLAMNAQ